ncbi:hypothetical protein C8J57DRAFT_1395736 [Mycena rebaudengoi]|nr:hypothetical protein C8J57DRAFT_1395736 [Mycena rebaudengoi]
MAVNIPLIPVTLASLVLESCFYGIFFLLSATSFWLLLQRDVPGKSLARSTLLSPYFVGTVALSVFITGHWVMSIYRVFQAFIYFDNGTFPLGFLRNLGHFSETLKNSFFCGEYRNRRYSHRSSTVDSMGIPQGVIVFPVCTLLGLLVCSGQLVYQLSQFRPGEDIFLSVAGRWVRTDTILTLITNSYCTALISWRLWTASKVGVQPHRGANIKHILSIVIESATLYTTWNLMFFVSYETQSNLQFIFIDCWPVMTGIAFTLIHVRVGWDGIQRRRQPSTTSSRSVPGPLSFTVGIPPAVQKHSETGTETATHGSDTQLQNIQL